MSTRTAADDYHGKPRRYRVYLITNGKASKAKTFRTHREAQRWLAKTRTTYLRHDAP
ncbi:hypothetical protein ACFVFQ_34815 [Streptomyces sp. NPDC057743]|uniref:hypothetical protein n=1 Tax=Streptomyces sp. NPDC057743 TaxID=3346236 RepID=UPI0036AFE9D3